MSRKRKSYSADFKAKLVLELLEGEKTLNEIASKYEVLPKSLQDWKKQFLANASLAFDKSAVVKEYKEKIKELEIQKDATAKKLGEVIVERDWAVGKLRSLDLSTKKEMIDTTEGVRAKTSNPSLNRQLGLLHMSKTAYYYKPVVPFESDEDRALLNMIDKIHTKYPYYGTRRVVKLLKRVGFNVGRKLIKHAFEFMGIRSLYPKPKTTVANREHKKYPYLLNEFKNDNNQVVITEPNRVWSTDITYIKLQNGFAYLAAIIDWHTKKILSWRLSNTMDVRLTTSVLQDALSKYPKPEIFNTDQGSQYTAKAHVEILVKHNISISMDAKGRSIDNIVIERFWRSLKYEDVYPKSYTTLREARRGIGEYIDLYNSQRLHSALDYKTPDEVYYQGANNRCYDAKKALLEVA
ncbi:MAG TPA: IS3 family transposase [Epsilonproteobacteria bacterium]|nr:IS3 family transposase [Campylobacterota bacterium]